MLMTHEYDHYDLDFPHVWNDDSESIAPQVWPLDQHQLWKWMLKLNEAADLCGMEILPRVTWNQRLMTSIDKCFLEGL